MSITAAELVALAKSRIREIEPAALQSLPAERVLIDVREPAEFATGHLPGAVNIPRGLLEFEIAAHPAVANVTDPALADKQRALVVYCAAGGRAALATDVLQQMGFAHVVSLRGGIKACIDAGLSLTTHQ
jgi:rhodanese-related sulfurtransferase